MDNHYAVKCVNEGMELYFRAFALADNIDHHVGDIEWISPLPDAAGPALVFRVSLDEETAASRIDDLIPQLKAGTVPSLWVITPASTPPNILDILLAKGFAGPSDSEHPEFGMALDIEMAPTLPASNPRVEVRKVRSLSEFASWIDVVNEALHGWQLLNTEHYSPWLFRGEFSFYLAHLDGTPISTVATMQDGDKASIEFVSTLKEYRHQGAATTTCMEALRELRNQGVKTVTLRSSSDAASLYARLGFKPYFEQILVSYPRV